MVSVFFTAVCPILGTIICNVMYASPLFGVLKAREKGSLGELNPLPWLMTLQSCIGWTIYGILTKNPFLFVSNLPGLCCGLFFCLTAIRLLSKRGEDKDIIAIELLERGIVGGIFAWGIVGMVGGMCLGESLAARELGISMIGYLGVAYTLAYYTAPLSTMYTVIKTKDASSIDGTMIIANFVNAILWLVYGSLGEHNLLIWGPNVIGLLLCILQLSMKLVYPSKGMVKTVEVDRMCIPIEYTLNPLTSPTNASAMLVASATSTAIDVDVMDDDETVSGTDETGSHIDGYLTQVDLQ